MPSLAATPGIWALAQTKPRQEWRFCRWLIKRGDLGYFVPQERCKYTNRNVYAKPLFPSYAFVHGSAVHDCLGSGYLLRLIRVPLGDVGAMVQQLTRLERDILSGAPLQAKLSVGADVQVARGALVGLHGPVVAGKKHGRVIIALNILGGAPVELDGAIIESVDRHRHHRAARRL